jgi:hypothetical protein
MRATEKEGIVREEWTLQHQQACAELGAACRSFDESRAGKWTFRALYHPGSSARLKWFQYYDSFSPRDSNSKAEPNHNAAVPSVIVR